MSSDWRELANLVESLEVKVHCEIFLFNDRSRVPEGKFEVGEVVRSGFVTPVVGDEQQLIHGSHAWDSHGAILPFA